MNFEGHTLTIEYIQFSNLGIANVQELHCDAENAAQQWPTPQIQHQLFISLSSGNSSEVQHMIRLGPKYCVSPIGEEAHSTCKTTRHR